MQKMLAMQVGKARGNFELVEKPIPEAVGNLVRVKVEACGVCHSDVIVKDGLFPGIKYPRVPGHEVIGVVDAVGPEAKNFSPGQRVGIGWHGGQCFTCDSCRRGDFITCDKAKICGISYDGGYAQYMVAPQDALARVPDALGSVAGAPLMCAGVTTFNALRHSGARPGDVVGVQGLGGLGHLGIQFAKAMGFHVAAISTSDGKRELAMKLGAHEYINTSVEPAARKLRKLGGAAAILATAPDSKTMHALIEALGAGGKLLVIGAGTDPIPVTPIDLIMKRKSIMGWPSGHAMDSQECLEFAALTKTHVMVEEFPLEKAADAFEHMMSGKVRFRAVLKMT